MSVWIVTNTNDSGSGSLRYYISNAAAGDTIQFADSLMGNTINLTSGTLQISKPLTIQGLGAGLLTIDGRNLWNSIFKVDPAVNAQISSLKIVSTNYSTIENSGYLNVTNCDLSGANAIHFHGDYGGTLGVINCIIHNSRGDGINYDSFQGTGGTLTVTDSVISNNYGSGIYVYDLTSGAHTSVRNCTISDNGGTGIFNPKELTVTNSTISGNKGGSGFGGGIYNGIYGTATVTNSTISGNTGSNGGINNVGSLTVNNSTIARNAASSAGGGIYEDSLGTITLVNTIVANNASGSGPDMYIEGTATANYCLIGDTAGPGTIAGSGNIRNQDPLLPWQPGNYGGPTPTMPLLPGSPAIGKGNLGLIPPGITTDQRGLSRIVGGTVDIGACENQSPLLCDFSKSTSKNTSLTFATNDFASSFIDLNPSASLQTVRITQLPSHGTLAVSGTGVAVGQQIGVSSLANLTYLPNTDYLGSDSFRWNAADDTANNYSASDAAVNITVNPAITLDPVSLAGGVINVAYSQTITAAGGTGDIGLTVSNVQNPISGLSLPTSGAGTLNITGTPTVTGTETFTLTATDSVGVTFSRNYSITVYQPPSINSLTATPTIVSVAGELTLRANGVDGTVLLVDFYQDVNENGLIDTGEPLLGTSTAGSDWTCTFGVSELPFGTNHYVARAQDSHGIWSNTVSTTATTIKATPTITVNNPGGAYNQAPFPATALIAGVFSGIDTTPSTTLEGIGLTLTYYVGASPNGDGTTIAPEDAGTYTVIAAFPGSPDYTAAQSTPLTFNITRATLTANIAVSDKVYDGNTAAVIIDRWLAGVFGSDQVRLAGGVAAFANKNVGTDRTVTATGLTLTGADADNYQLTSSMASTAADVTARPLTVTATGVNKTYDGTTTATVTLLDNRITGDVLTRTYLAASFDDKNAGLAKQISVSGVSISGIDSGNYQLASTTASTTARITARTLAVAATGVNKTYDGTTVATVTLSDNRIGEDLLTDTYAAAVFDNKNVGIARPVSVSGLSISGTDAGNYQLASTTTSTTANITVRAITVTAAANTKIYDGTIRAAAMPTITGGLGTGDEPNFTEAYDTKNVGTDKTLSVAGTVNDNNSGNNYSVTFVGSSTGTITVRTLTVTARGVNKTYNGTTKATVTLLDDRMDGDVLTKACTAAVFDAKDVGTAKPISVFGISVSGDDAANYQLASTTASTTANVTTRALAVTAMGINKTYDGTTAATVTLLDNRIDGDVLIDSYTAAAFDNRNAGIAKPVIVNGISISGTDAGNYQLAFTTTSTSASVTVRAVTVTAVANTKTYDGTMSAIAAPTITEGLAIGDTPNFTETYATKDVGTNKTLTPAGTVNDGNGGNNYSVAFVDRNTGMITARTLVVTATGVDKAYDFTTVAAANLGDNRVTGDQLTTTYTDAAFDDANVGTGKTVTVIGIAVSGGTDAGNYLLHNTTAITTANITPAPIGPETLGLNLTPSPIQTTAMVTATASDANAGNYKIIAAEYFFDSAGQDGKGIAMKALDKKFNSPTEFITATLRSTLTKLSQGPHTLYVHAKDASGKWGSCATVGFVKDTLGPVTSNLQVTPSAAAAPPTVTVTIDDMSTGQSNLAAAELFIDKLGKAGRGTPFDATFDSVTQTVTATLDEAAFSKLSQGKHTVYVRGKDALGRWGKAVSVAFTKDTLGPAATNVKVSPSSANTPPAVIATIDDTRSGSSNIVAVEYFVDVQGVAGTGVAMSASDGLFGSPKENVLAVIDAALFASLGAGKHTLYVHGEDALGHWGAFKSTTFQKLAVKSQEPLAAAISAAFSSRPSSGNRATLIGPAVTDAAILRFFP